MAWNFQRTEQTFQQIPAGDHRVVIDSAEQAVSKSGNDMLVIKLRVSGYSSMLWHYIVFMDDRPEITNQKLTQFFDSFGIADDQGYSKVAWFIHKNKQDNLPPWKGDLPEKAEPKPVETPEDCPW